MTQIINGNNILTLRYWVSKHPYTCNTFPDGATHVFARVNDANGNKSTLQVSKLKTAIIL